ncbi:major head protein [Vibrio phage D518]
MSYTPDSGQQKYGANVNGTDSTMQPQLSPYLWWKKALIEAAREQYFTQMADVKSMPKHMGKQIKKYHWMPLLDDRNVNDQGIDATGADISDGNLYGSSRDIGTIQGKLPALSETGGRVNRVGFTRLTIEGTFEKFGFFDEFTQESLDFDSEEELFGHMQTEMIKGASQMTEAALQIDLLNAAGVHVYGGGATAKNEVSGADGAETLVTYEDLMKLDIELFDNRTPKQTTIITGSRMQDTKTIKGGYVAYISSALRPTLERMVDLHGERAFIPTHQYGAATTIMRGEIGTVGNFRFIEVPEMLHWAGAGAAEGTNGGYRATNGKYDVFPMLVVGAESFTTIGFQTNGNMVKFKTTTKMPGEGVADRADPYGETGFSSIKWYYGTMIMRPERIACIYSPAEV